MKLTKRGNAMQHINELKKGDKFLGYLFIKSQLAKTASNGSRYFNMTLSDDNYDTIEAKMWNVKPADEEDFITGKLVAINGNVQDYNGHLQMIINKIRLTNQGDSVDIADYVKTAPVSFEKMYTDLTETCEAFKNPQLSELILTILADKKQLLTYVPAAKSFHHAMRGGLLYHTWSMLQLGKAITPLYPFLNADLVYAGIILHDLGKTTEMDSDENGIVSDYTKEGKLLGHIVSQIVAIDRYGSELGTDPELLLLLKHMVLSHHYEPEYGSPVRPMFPEAELLHHIDIIDARMNAMEEVQNNITPGGFSEKVWALDQIQMYRCTL